MESILEENKTYLSQESKELLEEVMGDCAPEEKAKLSKAIEILID